jgi:hypothetical protein
MYKDKPIRNRGALLKRMAVYTMLLGLFVFWMFGGFKRWFSGKTKEAGYDSPANSHATPSWFSRLFEKQLGASCPLDLQGFGCLGSWCNVANTPEELIRQGKIDNFKTIHFLSPRQNVDTMQTHFEHDVIIQLPYIRDAQHAEQLVDLIIKTNVEKVVFHGLVKGLLDLPAFIKQKSRVKVLVVHHGTPASHGVPHGAGNDDGIQEALVLKQLLQLTQQGHVDRIGVSKTGLAEALNTMGISTSQILVYPPVIEAPEHVDKKQHPVIENLNKVGIDVSKVKDSLPIMTSKVNWLDAGWKRPPGDTLKRIGILYKDHKWRANVYPQILATCLVPNSVVHVFGGEVLPLVYLELCSGRNATILQHQESDTWHGMKQMDVNLFVTLSESAPSDLLESLVLGVPALTSATNDVYQDSDLKQLVVVELDSPAKIAEGIKHVLKNSVQIKQALPGLLAEYTKRAALSWQDFLSMRTQKFINKSKDYN